MRLCRLAERGNLPSLFPFLSFFLSFFLFLSFSFFLSFSLSVCLSLFLSMYIISPLPHICIHTTHTFHLTAAARYDSFGADDPYDDGSRLRPAILFHDPCPHCGVIFARSGGRPRLEDNDIEKVTDVADLEQLGGAPRVDVLAAFRTFYAGPLADEECDIAGGAAEMNMLQYCIHVRQCRGGSASAASSAASKKGSKKKKSKGKQKKAAAPLLPKSGAGVPNHRFSIIPVGEDGVSERCFHCMDEGELLCCEAEGCTVAVHPRCACAAEGGPYAAGAELPEE